MHYLLQSTLDELEAACADEFDGLAWVKSWKHQGGGMYIGQLPDGAGQINVALAGIVGNPSKPWFEVLASKPAALVAIRAVANESASMKAELRSNNALQGLYRASQRGMIRNGAGKAVGVVPMFTICGRDAVSSYMDGEDVDEAQEIPGLEQ